MHDLLSVYVPSVVVIAGFGIVSRWLVSLTRRVQTLAERIAYLEASIGKRTEREGSP
jgi:hypothetical protein